MYLKFECASQDCCEWMLQAFDLSMPGKGKMTRIQVSRSMAACE